MSRKAVQEELKRHDMFLASGQNDLVQLNTVREEFGDTEDALIEFSRTMNDFSQDFMRELWDEGDNVVFSPFSLHSVLAILLSGVTPNTKTEKELLNALGGFQNIEGLEQRYQKMIKNYQTQTILSFGNKLWVTKDRFERLQGRYIERLSGIYDAQLDVLRDENPAKVINEWVSEITKGKIDKVIGNNLM